MSPSGQQEVPRSHGAKPRMLDAEEVVQRTSHPVGGVCPFGVAEPLQIYCDESLKRFDIVCSRRRRDQCGSEDFATKNGGVDLRHLG